jgi:hypothetical protein
MVGGECGIRERKKKRNQKEDLDRYIGREKK